MTQGKCAKCGKEGDMPFWINGIQYCSSDCHRFHSFRPYMTDETYKEDTTIDLIHLDGGKECIEMQTPDSFYSTFSGYKVIVIQYRMFWHKQLCGFRTVAEAQKAWKKLKEDKNLKSWADLHKDELTLSCQNPIG